MPDPDTAAGSRRRLRHVGELIESVPQRLQGIPERISSAHAWRHGRRTLTLVAVAAAMLGVMFATHTAERTTRAFDHVRDEQTWSSWKPTQSRLVEVAVDGSDIVAFLAVPGALDDISAVGIPPGRTVSLTQTVTVLVSPDGERVMLADIARPPVWTTIMAAASSTLGTALWFLALFVFCRRSSELAAADTAKQRVRVLSAGAWARIVAAGICVAVPAWATATVAASSWANLGSTVANWGLGVVRIVTFATLGVLLVAVGAWGALWLSANPTGGHVTVRRAHRVLSSSATHPRAVRKDLPLEPDTAAASALPPAGIALGHPEPAPADHISTPATIASTTGGDAHDRNRTRPGPTRSTD